MKSSFVLILLSFCIAFYPAAAGAQGKQYTFKKGQVVKVAGKFCGLVSGKWIGVKRVSKKSKRYVKDTTAGKRCKKLLGPKLVKGRGLSVLPSLTALVKEQSSASTVSGVAPTLSEISPIVKTLFWNDGEVDAIRIGEPSSQQCGNFFSGTTDGASAGLLGCYGVESFGRAFQAVLDGTAGTCYMSRVASQGALASGGLDLIDGELPPGGITRLFAPPSGNKARVIKINIEGFPGEGAQTGFLVVDAESKLASEGNQYAYTSYFCNPGASTPTNYERTTITLDGRFKLRGFNTNGASQFENTIEAALTQSGSNVVFDLSKQRSARSAMDDGAASRFKAVVTLNPDGTLDLRSKEREGSAQREVAAKSRITGSDITTLRVLESALRSRFDATPLTSAFEFRDSAYVSAPNNTLLVDVPENVLSAPFFSADAEVEPSFSGKSCSVDADITLRLDFGVPAMAAIAEECETRQLPNQSFCFSNEDIGAALTQYPNKCVG